VPDSQGTRIKEEMVWTKRPDGGIPATNLDKVIGWLATVDIPVDHLIRWDELE